MVYIQERELCPTFDEMKRATGAASNRRIFELLAQLEERGYISSPRWRTSGRRRPRALTVLRRVPVRLKVVYGPDHWERRAALSEVPNFCGFIHDPSNDLSDNLSDRGG
jgi:SOS-response transcriptional repressor LexA